MSVPLPKDRMSPQMKATCKKLREQLSRGVNVSLLTAVRCAIHCLLLTMLSFTGCSNSGTGSSVQDDPTDEQPLVEAVVPDSLKAGLDVYEQKCSMCHTGGEAGAPRLANPRQWTKRTPKGLDTLTTNAFDGFEGEWGEMPPQSKYFNREQVRAAVEYMLFRDAEAAKAE